MTEQIKMETGEWYEVEIIVPKTKRLTGRLLRVLPTETGKVFMFEGRFPFAVEEDQLVSTVQTEAPKTGVRKS